MKVLALLRDSFRETLDRKSFVVLGVVAALLIVFCLGISFAPLDERAAMDSLVGNFNLVAGRTWAKRYESATFEVAEFRAEEREGRRAYRLSLKASPPPEVHRMIRHWQGVRLGKCRGEGDPVPDAALPVEADLQKRFLEARFRDALIPDVDVEPAGDLVWDVRIHAAGRKALSGAEEMRLFFGLVRWRPRTPDPVPSTRRFLSSAEIVRGIHLLMGEFLAGFVGILVAVIVTAGSVPGLLQKGTLDFVLSRPVERSTLLIYKYIGGCVYIFLLATLVIGGCWLALSLRTGYWNPWFPLTILTLTFFFAVLYSVSVLVGVLTRSAGAAAFTAILTWGVCWAVGQTRFFLESPGGGALPPALGKAVRFVYLLLPKTADLALLNNRLIAKGTLGEASALVLPDWLPATDYATVFFTSALFALLMISLAGVSFSKRDY